MPTVVAAHLGGRVTFIVLVAVRVFLDIRSSVLVAVHYLDNVMCCVCNC